jgi:hypothetical protein
MACVFLYKNTNTNPKKDTTLYHNAKQLKEL